MGPRDQAGASRAVGRLPSPQSIVRRSALTAPTTVGELDSFKRLEQLERADIAPGALRSRQVALIRAAAAGSVRGIRVDCRTGRGERESVRVAAVVLLCRSR